MRGILLTVLVSIAAVDAAGAEPLDRRFGPDHERGYRSSREFDRRSDEFRNLDRANFLGVRQADDQRLDMPRQDLQAPLAIGMQR